jgi:hypothetical protein
MFYPNLQIPCSIHFFIWIFALKQRFFQLRSASNLRLSVKLFFCPSTDTYLQ